MTVSVVYRVGQRNFFMEYICELKKCFVLFLWKSVEIFVTSVSSWNRLQSI